MEKYHYKLWDAEKVVRRGKIIDRTSRLKKERLKQQKVLESIIKVLEMKHRSIVVDSRFHNQSY